MRVYRRLISVWWLAWAISIRARAVPNALRSPTTRVVAHIIDDATTIAATVATHFRIAEVAVSWVSGTVILACPGRGGYDAHNQDAGHVFRHGLSRQNGYARSNERLLSRFRQGIDALGKGAEGY